MNHTNTLVTRSRHARNPGIKLRNCVLVLQGVPPLHQGRSYDCFKWGGGSHTRFVMSTSTLFLVKVTIFRIGSECGGRKNSYIDDVSSRSHKLVCSSLTDMVCIMLLTVTRMRGVGECTGTPGPPSYALVHEIKFRI